VKKDKKKGDDNLEETNDLQGLEGNVHGITNTIKVFRSSERKEKEGPSGELVPNPRSLCHTDPEKKEPCIERHWEGRQNQKRTVGWFKRTGERY